MDIKEFNLSDKRIVIYGASSIGGIAFRAFSEMGYSIQCFVDKRGDSIKRFKEREVLSIERIDKINRELPVFVAVKNVFEHSKIANELSSRGFHSLIFRPQLVIQGGGSIEEKRLNEVYDKLINRENWIDNIPQTFYSNVCSYSDNVILDNGDADKVTVLIPLEWIFTDSQGEVYSKWSDIPALCLVPHISFFRWLDHQSNRSYEMYIDYCKDAAGYFGDIETSDGWVSNVLKNRSDVYVSMNRSLEVDPLFFVRNAVDASWNKRGYFNIRSGKHRIAFYISKGRRFIPIKVTRDDYCEFSESLDVFELSSYIKKNHISTVNGPIEYPGLYRFPCLNDLFWFRVLEDFLYIVVSNSETKGIEFRQLLRNYVYLFINDDGYLRRCLTRFGFNTIILYSRSGLEQKIDELSSCFKSNNAGGEIKDKNYSYAILDYQLISIANCEISPLPHFDYLVLISDKEMGEYMGYNVIEQKKCICDGKIVFLNYMIGE